jgi:hypothetical protein
MSGMPHRGGVDGMHAFRRCFKGIVRTDVCMIMMNWGLEYDTSGNAACQMQEDTRMQASKRKFGKRCDLRTQQAVTELDRIHSLHRSVIDLRKLSETFRSHDRTQLIIANDKKRTLGSFGWHVEAAYDRIKIGKLFKEQFGTDEIMDPCKIL